MRHLRTFYITTPIYYPNADPHIGHAFTTIVADVIARWKRLDGYNVFFLTGTDEHGLKLQQAAEKAGKDPKSFVDEMSERFKRFWKDLNISYDRFIRTTDRDHEEVVKWALEELYKKGYIYKGRYKGWYCISCESFLTEDDWYEENGEKYCKVHRKKLVWMEEESYFLKISEFKDFIMEYLRSGHIVPENYANEMIARIEKHGLLDLSITRPKERVYWGIEAPFDGGHTIYVWIDALLNYISGIKFLEDKDFFGRYWSNVHHVIGKDILWFHSVIWPIVLEMLGIKPPKKIIVHGFWTVEGQKMGKSLGNVIWIPDLIKYGTDAGRYFLLRTASFEKDSDFSWRLFKERYNNELIGIFGNLVRRVGILAMNRLNGRVRRDEVEERLRGKCEEVLERAREYVDEFRLNLALKEVFSIFSEINSYLNEREPWKEEDPNRTLYNSLEGIRFGVNLLYPFMPETCERVSKAFGFEIKKFDELRFGEKEGYEIKEAPILFKKIE